MALDVAARMKAIGATWNAETRTWTVPRERRAELHALLAGLGLLGQGS